MSSLRLEVAPRGKPFRGLPQELSISAESSAAQIYDALATKTKASVHRIRITKGSDGAAIPNSLDTTVKATGLLDGSKIVVKDLGMLDICSTTQLNITNSFKVLSWDGNSSFSSNTSVQSSSIR